MTGQVIAPTAFAASAERHVAEMERWRKRSRRIGRLRVLFPAAIVAILVALGVWLAVGQFIGPGPAKTGSSDAIHMSNARFLGRDNQGRPFVLTAEDATRDELNVQKIGVTQPALVIDPDSPDPVRVSADRGVYHEDTRMLMLNGHVAVRDGRGDAFDTDQAIVDTVKGVVAGQSAVSGRGPMGAIRADSYAVYDRGQRLVFQGEVHSRLNAH